MKISWLIACGGCLSDYYNCFDDVLQELRTKYKNQKAWTQFKKYAKKWEKRDKIIEDIVNTTGEINPLEPIEFGKKTFHLRPCNKIKPVRRVRITADD